MGLFDHSEHRRSRSTPVAEPMPAPRTRVNLQPAGALLAASVLAAIVSLPGAAHAYRTFEDDPEIAYPARWPAIEVGWELSRSEVTDERFLDQLAASATAALSTWDAVECADFSPGFDGITAASATLGDGRNTITVVTTGWASRGFPAGRGATTEVRFQRAADGTAWIIEADIYLNLVDYDFVFDASSPDELDPQAVLTHELGHALGLLHPCEHEPSAGVPACAEDAAFAETALFPDYVGLEARVLAADDQLGICSLYAGAPLCEPVCADGQECRAGICIERPDPCPDGVCPPSSCASDDECADGVCAIGGPSAGRCVASGATGAACATARDCAAGLCLTSRHHGSYCTVECDEIATCIGMQRCVALEGTDVCAPLPSAQGCTIGTASRPRAHAALAFGIVLCSLWLRRRARWVRHT